MSRGVSMAVRCCCREMKRPALGLASSSARKPVRALGLSTPAPQRGDGVNGQAYYRSSVYCPFTSPPFLLSRLSWRISTYKPCVEKLFESPGLAAREDLAGQLPVVALVGAVGQHDCGLVALAG